MSEQRSRSEEVPCVDASQRARKLRIWATANRVHIAYPTGEMAIMSEVQAYAFVETLRFVMYECARLGVLAIDLKKN
jgi:hypothetical protein